jgi:hypothetical protein
MYRRSETRFAHLLAHDNGISYCYSRTSPMNVSMLDDDIHPDALEFFHKLSAYHKPSAGAGEIKRLYDYQVRAAVNLAYRPRLVTVQGNGETTQSVYDYEIDSERGAADVGSIALNDLPTGSGKTITSCVAALEFAATRGPAVAAAAKLLVREQASDQTWTDGVARNSSPTYSDIVLIFAPRHLTQQWEAAVNAAMYIQGKAVVVRVNPLARNLKTLASLEPAVRVVAIYDNVQKLPDHIAFVPVIVVDEFVLRGDHNIAAKLNTKGTYPLYGRLILVSADAGNVNRTLPGLRSGCILQKFSKRQVPAWRHVHSCQSMAATSCVDGALRAGIPAAMGLDAPVIVHDIKYVPTLGGVMFGSSFEISRKCGSAELARMGVDTTRCKTISDIVAAIERRIAAVPASISAVIAAGRGEGPLLVAQLNAQRDRLHGIIHRIHMLDTDQCPICFDAVETACILQPCWHLVCEGCMRAFIQSSSAGVRCPMCRGRIGGHTVAAAAGAAAEDVERAPSPAPPSWGETIEDSIVARLGEAPSLFKCTMTVLMCLEHHFCASAPAADTPNYRVLVCVPEGLDFEELATGFRAEVGEDRAWMAHFQIVGTATAHVTAGAIAKQLAAFNDAAGPRLKVLFTSEGARDSMTGLDLNNVDALITLGAGNQLQRVGRLTRLGRKFAHGCVHCFHLVPMA